MASAKPPSETLTGAPLQHAMEQAIEEAEPGRGRLANTPIDIPARGWKDILWRVWESSLEDRVLTLAGGMAFFCLLAIFPGLSAFVTLYGLVADVTTINSHLSGLAFVLPAGAFELISDQINLAVKASSGALSLNLALSFLFALWSANAGIKATIDGLNIAYGEREQRGILALNVESLIFTLLAIAAGIGAIAFIVAVPIAMRFLEIDRASEVWINFLRWPILGFFVWVALAILYRFGPCREQAKWRWVTWGSTVAATLWILTSISFSWYVSSFGSYDRNYGALGAIIGFMTWIWLSATVILLGAELNAEMEHQTARDSTVGRPKPLGKRGAMMADSIGKTQD
ncbi:YihY/virulence factor BrkB family protein [Kaistia terrae]|uniref:YihY/virulence factor BrkB family protein n=1 Tax=Kaistia terrae TaxID=537017 RepID=A0ABW0PYH5_9HYPH|nr:YihY/virulence factor BrkB family protein [Kaistia terrae]MCX5580864.1 YihY/virulence factor BrkB family protein [Kaistia terrae]